MRKKYKLEYTVNSSPSILFNRLSTPGGLAEWFADNVNLNGEILTFYWKDTQEKAQLIAKKENKFVRYRWLDCDDKDCFFEFRLHLHELTRDVALEIIDFAEENDMADAIELWDTQIGKLKHKMGF